MPKAALPFARRYGGAALMLAAAMPLPAFAAAVFCNVSLLLLRLFLDLFTLMLVVSFRRFHCSRRFTRYLQKHESFIIVIAFIIDCFSYLHIFIFLRVYAYALRFVVCFRV